MGGEKAPRPSYEPSDGFLGESRVPHDLERDMVLSGLKKAVEDGKLKREDFETYKTAYISGYLGRET